jgi:hypothetical protein
MRSDGMIGYHTIIAHPALIWTLRPYKFAVRKHFDQQHQYSAVDVYPIVGGLFYVLWISMGFSFSLRCLGIYLYHILFEWPVVTIYMYVVSLDKVLCLLAVIPCT